MWCMPRQPLPEPVTRKTVSLPDSMWEEIANFRFEQRIGSEAEAVRRLLLAGLRAEARKATR
jgi:hypothetical protein